MANHHQWLRDQISDWQADGLISHEQADALRARYSVTPAARGWTMMLVPVIGAVLIGLGIILLFAYNWAALPGSFKIALVVAGTAATHAAGLYFDKAPRHNELLSESLHMIGTMLFGAGIWLVAQVYNFDIHFPLGLLFWAIGALALAWARPSLPQAMLAGVLLAGWSAADATGYGNANLFAPLLVLLGLAPLAWRFRSLSLVFLTTAAFLLMSGLSLSAIVDFRLPGHYVFLLASSILALATFAARTSFSDSQGPMRLVAALVHIVPVFLLSFHEAHVWRLIDVTGALGVTGYWVLFGLTVLAWAISLVTGAMTNQSPYMTAFNALVVAAVLLVGLASVSAASSWHLAIVIGLNLILVAQAINLILAGATDPRGWAMTMTGFAGLGILIFARFAGFLDSLLARSAAFIALGVALFVIGYWFARRQRRVDHA